MGWVFVEDSYICMRCTALQVPGVGELRVCGTPEAPAQPCQPPGPPLPSQGPLRRTTCPHHFHSCLDRHQARCLTVRSPQNSSSEPTLTGRTCPCPETAKKHTPAAPKLSPTPQLPAAASACLATQPSPLRPVTEQEVQESLRAAAFLPSPGQRGAVGRARPEHPAEPARGPGVASPPSGWAWAGIWGSVMLMVVYGTDRKPEEPEEGPPRP